MNNLAASGESSQISLSLSFNAHAPRGSAPPEPNSPAGGTSCTAITHQESARCCLHHDSPSSSSPHIFQLALNRNPTELLF